MRTVGLVEKKTKKSCAGKNRKSKPESGDAVENK